MELSSSCEEGALIVIKEAAERVDSVFRDLLGQMFEKNYENWIEFVRRRSPTLPLHEMVFVTGYDLASDWATAIVSESNTNVKIRFKASDTLTLQTMSAAASMWGSWEYSSDVPVRIGPSTGQKRMHVANGPSKNQCIFLRAFRISRKGFKYRASAGPHVIEPVGDDPDDSSLSLIRNIEDDSEVELDCRTSSSPNSDDVSR